MELCKLLMINISPSSLQPVQKMWLL